MSLLMLLLPLTLFATADEPAVLVDQCFTILQPGGDDAIGNYSLYAEEAGGRVTIKESLELTAKGQEIGMASTVIYKAGEGQSWLLHEAEATTTVAGQQAMKASLVPEEGPRKWKVKMSLHVGRRGETLDEPKTIERTVNVPEGPVLFSLAQAVIGPRIQPEPGEQPIVWVEFPDDVDESLNIKHGFSIVRSQADADGGYTLTVRSERRELGAMPLTRDGKILPHKLWGEAPLREE